MYVNMFRKLSGACDASLDTTNALDVTRVLTVAPAGDPTHWMSQIAGRVVSCGRTLETEEKRWLSTPMSSWSAADTPA